jgi:hypothetical protein
MGTALEWQQELATVTRTSLAADRCLFKMSVSSSGDMTHVTVDSYINVTDFLKTTGYGNGFL